MQKRKLGRNGPEVSALGLGCLSFGGIFGPTTEAESLRTLDAAWDHGIDFLDTANIYGEGISESVIGTWLKSRGHRPHIATKAAFSDDPARRIDNRPEHMRAELEGSLKRLGTDHVTLFYAHRHDPMIPIEDLAGKSIAVNRGTLEDTSVTEVAPKDADIQRFNDYNGVISAFLSGQVQLMVVGNDVGAAVLAKQPAMEPESKFQLLNSPSAMAINKGEDRLLAKLDEALATMKKDGTLDAISKKWLFIPLPKEL